MRNILLIEDDPLLGKIFKTVLEEAGFYVLWAIDAEQSYGLLEQSRIDLIFLDIMLPGGTDGYQILAMLKSTSSQHKNIPVVVLSNLEQKNESEKAEKMGALKYIIKANIDLEQLVDLARDITRYKN